MNHLSLFSGIGGFDLAAEWVGWDNVSHCELNDFCLQILKFYWPGAKSHKDIRSTDFSIYRGIIDVVTGGDPCQRNSNANRSGNEVAESLGGEYIRAVSQIMPRYIVRENPAVIRKDAPWPAWIFAAELENMGYIVPTPFRLQACCTGASIRRQRVFVFAYLPLTKCERLERDELKKMAFKKAQFKQSPNIGRPGWRNPSPEFCNGINGLSTRLDSITFPAWRTESIKALGNAIAPEMAYRILQFINDYERDT